MKEYIVQAEHLIDMYGMRAIGELIRCKDCKHHHYEHHYENKIPYCNLIDYGYGWEDNDFCSRAERKEK